MSRAHASAVAAVAGLVLALSLPASLLAQDIATKIDIVGNGIGVPPTDFEFWRTGDGDVGRWAVVRDATAAGGVAIEQFSTDHTEQRFLLAIYKPISVKSVTISARIKIIEGSQQSVGIALRLSSASNCYAVSVSALETRVDFYRIVEGKRERIAGVDTDIFRGRWHTRQAVADDDRITVTLDKQPLFAAWDRTFASDGPVALWTEDDTVARFEQVEITPLPWSESR